MRWLLKQVVKLLTHRMIFDRDGKKPYLSRYYISKPPRMADGSDPFDKLGNPKPDSIWPKGIGVYIHQFHEGDMDQNPHSHPFEWAVSLILAGGYKEERTVGKSIRFTTKTFTPGMLNFLKSTDFHRVDLLEEDAWTLFIVGPKTTNWGFKDRNTGVVKNWREYLDEKRRSLS